MPHAGSPVPLLTAGRAGLSPLVPRLLPVCLHFRSSWAAAVAELSCALKAHWMGEGGGSSWLVPPQHTTWLTQGHAPRRSTVSCQRQGEVHLLSLRQLI